MAQPEIAYDGQVFEDQSAFEAHINPNIPPELKRVYIYGNEDKEVKSGTDPGDDKMVVTPQELFRGRELDQTEVDPTTGLGLEIGLKVPSTDSTMPLGSTEKPAGEFKSPEGSQVPEKGTISNFFDRLSIVNPVKALLAGPNLGEDKAMLTGLYDTIKKAFQLPGDVYGGKIDPMSKQGIERAFDLASFAVLGPAPVAAKMADGTLGSFAGVKSQTFKGQKLNDLGHAQVMEAAGDHPDVIWSKTGMARGTDGRWRYEIDDSKSKFNKDWAANPTEAQKRAGVKSVPLPEVLDHPELYKAYPQLKDVTVNYEHAYPGTGAEWDSGLKIITMGKGSHGNQGVLMHEVQHAIQDIEGFAKGGNPMQAPKEYKLKYTNDFDALRPEMEEYVSKFKDPNHKWTPAELIRHDELTRIAEHYIKYTEGAYVEAYDIYKRLAGETEARNVDTRLLLNEKERRQMPPWFTEDEARRRQIPTNQPVSTTAYGYIDPKTNKYVKPKAEEPTNFRSAANDNDVQIKRAVDKIAERSKKITEVNKKIDDLMKKYPHSDIDKERLKRLRQERLDIWK